MTDLSADKKAQGALDRQYDKNNACDLPVHDEGYSKDLSERHMAMIALGGAIGTGFFLGAGGRLYAVGPSLAVVYAVCGLCAFMVLRAIGELVMYRPTSGSFVTYAREFLGEGGAYAAGWFFFLNWALSGIADISAVAMFMQYWSVFGTMPQWVIALAALSIVSLSNMAGVKYFGESEFWFSLIKIGSIILFLITGTVLLIGGWQLGSVKPDIHMIANHGGYFPHGFMAPFVLIQGVIFAYSATELIGVAAGECEDPRKVVPKAINSVIGRILLFYVGSITLLVMLLPWNAYNGGESPFVTFFHALGVPGLDSLMNFVVVTAALSSLNSGLYSTGRVLRALALGGSAPAIFAKLNKQKVPYVGIGVTIAIYMIGVALNYFIPNNVFEIALNISSIGILAAWGIIVLCQLRLHKAIKEGRIQPTTFPMPGSPWTGYLTLAFLLMVLTLIGFDYPSGTITIGALPLIFLAFGGGWILIKRSERRRAEK